MKDNVKYTAKCELYEETDKEFKFNVFLTKSKRDIIIISLTASIADLNLLKKTTMKMMKNMMKNKKNIGGVNSSPLFFFFLLSSSIYYIIYY